MKYAWQSRWMRTCWCGSDSYRFISGITRRMLRTWVEMEKPRPIPWSPLCKPLRESKVALLSSAGIALENDRPFDQEGERRNPWWGDPSYRVLPATATEADVRLYHMHIDPRPAEQDLNCLFPLARLKELEQPGRDRRGCRAALFDDGLYLAARDAAARDRARHHPRSARRAGGCGRAGACLTDLLLVRWTGTTRNRSRRVLHHHPDPHSCPGAGVSAPRIAAIEYPAGAHAGPTR
jgi:hypothetical protein